MSAHKSKQKDIMSQMVGGEREATGGFSAEMLEIAGKSPPHQKKNA